MWGLLVSQMGIFFLALAMTADELASHPTKSPVRRGGSMEARWCQGRLHGGGRRRSSILWRRRGWVVWVPEELDSAGASGRGTRRCRGRLRGGGRRMCRCRRSSILRCRQGWVARVLEELDFAGAEAEGGRFDVGQGSRGDGHEHVGAATRLLPQRRRRPAARFGWHLHGQDATRFGGVVARAAGESWGGATRRLGERVGGGAGGEWRRGRQRDGGRRRRLGRELSRAW